MKNKPVMLNLFQHLIITILCGVLICIGFTGCENFLNGAETKEKLEQLVKEANAPKVQIYIKADENAGSVSPAGLFECKLDSSFLILFEPQDGYEFLKWEVVDRNTGDPLTGAVVFEDETKNETRVTVKKNIENIRIQPVYVALPWIVSTAPAYYDSGVYANMPIEVTFNIPMINDDGSAFVFSFDNISIVANGNNVNRYFYTPELNADGKSLKIVPKALEFQEYILNQGKRAVDIQVSFNTEQISIVLGGNEYCLFQNANTVFSYKVNSTLETVSPVYDNLTVSKFNDGGNLSPEGALETQFNSLEVVKAHAIGKYVYIHGEAFDSDSGVKSIVLEETVLNDKAGVAIAPFTKKFVYDKTDLEIIKEENKQIEYKLQHELDADDGLVSLNIYVEDYCGNKSESTEYKLIKDTNIGIDNIFVYNYVFPKKGWGSAFETEINKTELLDEINNVKVFIESDLNTSFSDGSYYFLDKNYKKILYGSFEYPLENLIVECEYISKNGPVKKRMTIKESNIINPEKTSKYWALLDDNGQEIGLNVDSVAGLKFKIRISDDLDNSEEKEFQFPSTVESIKKIEPSASSVKVYFNTSTPCTGNIKFSTDNTKWNPFQTTDNYIQFSSGYNKDITLLNQDTNYTLLGPVHKVAIDDGVTGVNNTETREEVLNLLAPLITYSPCVPNSGSVIVTMNFDSQVWNYWDEIQFTDLYSGYMTSPNDKHLITKGTTTFVYEDDYAIGYTFDTSKITLNASKVSQLVKDANGNITQIESISGTKKITVPSLPESCYTFAPNVQSYDYYNMVDGKLVICPIKVTLSYKTQEIKRVIYWEKYGTEHIDSYIKKEGTGIDSNHPIIFYYTAENFLDFGDVTIVVEDQKGNTSAPIVITKPDMPYISKILSTTKVQLSKVLSGNAYDNINIHYSSFENSGWTHKSFPIAQGTDTYTIENPSSYGYIPEKKFVRFYITKEPASTNHRYYSQFSYLYYDSEDTNSHIGYILDDNRGVSVFSERPVFVYTVSTKRPYDECSKWKTSEWESTFHKISNEVVMDLHSQTELYQLDLTSLEPGDNYVVIAHFADGHTDKSAVRHFE